MFEAMKVRVVTNQMKGVCNRLDMILTDLDTLSDVGKPEDEDSAFSEVLEKQALGQISDLQQLILALTAVVGGDADEDNGEAEETDKGDEGDGSVFQANELNEASKKEEDNEQRTERLLRNT